MKERFKLIRKKEKLSQSDFGTKLGVSRDVIGNIEYGRVEPKLLLINHLCDVFNVNKEWLLTGQGDIYTVPEEEKELSNLLLNLDTENTELLSLITKLQKLDIDYLSMIDNLVENLLNKQKKQAD